MKKTYFLMLLALVFLVFSCRSELDNLQESEPGSVTVKKSFSSHLISLKTVKEEVKSFNNIQAKFTNSKLAKSVTAKSFNNTYLYRKLENAETGNITYTLPLNSYSPAKPYYFIQQIIIAPSGTETVQYLKIIPKNAPAYKTQDVLKNLTGSIELYDENLEMVASSPYVNGVAQTTASSGSGNIAGKTNGECDVDIITIEVPCSTSGQHGVGESCDPGITNDAHYETTIYVTCPHTFGPSTGSLGTSSGGGSSLGGGYVFDEQLNNLLTNPTFLYGDYITSPNHELLLQAVRAWIPNHVIDINGDLSDLNQRIEHFFNNDELFTNLVTYNQNTPNVPNAEVADYSIRVYELIKWLLNNPSPQNGQLAAWGVSFFDQNRFVSWEQFENWFITKSEGRDGEYIDNLDYIQNTIQYQTKQMPTYSQFVSVFPKLLYPGYPGYFKQMPAKDVYELVGDPLKSLYISKGGDNGIYRNACTVRWSFAMNALGILIPQNSLSLRGADINGQPRYYYIRAVTAGDAMQKIFGNPTHKLEGADANNPNKIAAFLKGKTGIYVIVNNDASQANYTGHVDLIQNGHIPGGANAYGVPGGIKSIRIWEFKP